MVAAFRLVEGWWASAVWLLLSSWHELAVWDEGGGHSGIRLRVARLLG